MRGVPTPKSRSLYAEEAGVLAEGTRGAVPPDRSELRWSSLDGSVLVGVLLEEHGRQALPGHLAADESDAVGDPTLAETGLVRTARLGRDARSLLSAFVREAGITVAPFVEEHARAAVEAYARSGRGRRPPAPDFDDCMAHAVARIAGQPLLCVGDDSPKTDRTIA